MGSAESDSCRENQAAVRFKEESSHAVPCNYVVIYWASTGTDLCSGADTVGQNLQPVERPRSWGNAASPSARRTSWKVRQRHSTTSRMARDQMMTGRAWTSAESRIPSLSPSWLRMLMAKSYTPIEGSLLRSAVLWRSLLEGGWLESIEPTFHEEAKAKWYDCIRTRTRLDVIWRFRVYDGTYRWQHSQSGTLVP